MTESTENSGSLWVSRLLIEEASTDIAKTLDLAAMAIINCPGPRCHTELTTDFVAVEEVKIRRQVRREKFQIFGMVALASSIRTFKYLTIPFYPVVSAVLIATDVLVLPVIWQGFMESVRASHSARQMTEKFIAMERMADALKEARYKIDPLPVDNPPRAALALVLVLRALIRAEAIASNLSASLAHRRRIADGQLSASLLRWPTLGYLAEANPCRLSRRKTTEL
ncbi:uncharacterized protein BXZ73DRAFT_99100 [Epithele typhae]|uniref:uncharacterized protein n=1 Tax=Epithele typhae TaxID=378194 RepID=UPI002007AC51|nr:uncharacterized protein BXZ73DRAFT_99100 [Epithele typhae]KAH9940100.1 hypothetical protein BXZ73DRAFT_99100 [Epithele typhae]